MQQQVTSKNAVVKKQECYDVDSPSDLDSSHSFDDRQLDTK